MVYLREWNKEGVTPYFLRARFFEIGKLGDNYEPRSNFDEFVSLLAQKMEEIDMMNSYLQ